MFELNVFVGRSVLSHKVQVNYIVGISFFRWVFSRKKYLKKTVEVES